MGLARALAEAAELRAQQAATADILKVIATSPADIQPVFDAIAQSAIRLIGGHSCSVTRVLGDRLHLASLTSIDPSADDLVRSNYPMLLTEKTVITEVVRSARTLLVSDTETDPRFAGIGRQVARSRGFRAIAYVPMRHQQSVLGVIHVARAEPRTITDQHVSLLESFADQAVIAIENARLFNETKEALERQTATAEILKVISGSPTDVQPVFHAIVRSATRLFACNSAIFMREGGLVRLESILFRDRPGDARDYDELRKVFPVPFDPEHNMASLAIASGRLLELGDTEGPDSLPLAREVGRRANIRSMTFVPLMREGVGFGVIGLSRIEPGFLLNEEQRALAQTFADQAVIAIENVRLFNETKESLERQTATAEILKVISESPTDTQPVFDAIAKSAHRLLTDAEVGIALVRGDRVELVASVGLREDRLDALRKTFPRPLDLRSSVIQVAVHGETIHHPDAQSNDLPAYTRETNRVAGVAAMAGAPLMRGGKSIGGIFISKTTRGAYSEKQIELLRTFADQAVIAIENVRLFNELQERTQALTRSVGQLTALGEVGQAISSTLDLEKVLPTVVARAVQLTGLDGGAIYEYDENQQVFNLRGGENVLPDLVELYRREPIRLGEGAVGGAAARRSPVQIPDIVSGYDSRARDVLVRAGARALLAVPLLREGHILGAIAVIRNAPGEFPPEVVRLLETFATQSAIAIQNARLFREIEEKGRELEIASQHKSQFLASMSHELRTPLNAILGFNEMMLDGLCGEVPEGFTDPLQETQTSGKHLLRLINNILDLAKIEAGRMELALANYAVQDMVEAVRSTLRPLAEAKGLAFSVEVPADLPVAHGDAGRLTQCLMNLAGNALKFTREGRVAISVEAQGDRLVFRVADTGIGIPPSKIDGLFTEFKQTDAAIASEYGGTGLGLAITRQFVEMHGGSIRVESEPGKGSTFIFEIPLRAEAR